MNHHVFNSLKARLTLMIVLVAAFILVVATVLFSIKDYQNFKKELHSNLDRIATITGDTATASLVFNDADAAKKILSSLKSQGEITLAFLINDNKTLLGMYVNKQVHKAPVSHKNLSQETIREISKKASEWKIRHVNKMGFSSVFKPIFFDKDLVGGIYVRAIKENLYNKIWFNIFMAGMILIIGLIIAVILALIVNRSFANPIARLASIMMQVTQRKDYSLRAVQDEAPNEISILAEGFNDMLGQIQIRDKELKGYHDSLEQKVKDKTQKLKESYKKIEYIAYHDVLTELPNMRLFKEIVANAIEHSKRNDEKIAVLFVDLDDFKFVNDSLGHNVGDEVLKEVAEQLSRELRTSDLVTRSNHYQNVLPIARLGGDEFTILLTNIKTNEDITRIVKRLFDVLENPVVFEEKELQIGMSVGIALYPTDGEDVSTLLKNADAAMYHAKALGKKGFQYFNQEIQDAINETIEMENDLRYALKKNELTLYYQPKIDLKTKQIVGAEALMRWQHPERGLIPLKDFIPIAERTSLICDLGYWCLEEACHQLREWLDNGISPFTMAINVSPKQFEESRLIEKIREKLEKYHLKPESLEIELTEKLIMTDCEKVLEKLNALRELGVKISIDDFGAGYCSFKYLSLFPLATIKIDRAFVSQLESDISDAAITRAIIHLAHNLGLNVIAEGVEEEGQAKYLLEHQCDLAQGVLYSQPLPAVAFTQMFFEKQPSSSIYTVGQYQQPGT